MDSFGAIQSGEHVAFGLGPGQAPMQPNQQNALAAAIRGVSPPQNAATPNIRQDPQHEWLIALQRIRITLNDAIDRNLDAQDPVIQSALVAFHNAIEKMLAGIDPKMIATLAAASLVKSFDPQTSSMLEMKAAQASAPPMVPGGPQITPGPMPMMPPGSLGTGMGMAPTAGMPGMPVSPPAPGGQL